MFTRTAIARAPLTIALALLAVVIGAGVWGARYIASRYRWHCGRWQSRLL